MRLIAVLAARPAASAWVRMASVSGGCIEGAVVREAQAVMTSGAPRVLEYGVTNERAWEVGLACGGTVRVFVEAIE